MFEEMGIIALLVLIGLIIFIPLIVTIVVGVALANMLGFTGIVWWAFVILFYLVIGAILSKVSTSN